MTKKSSDQQKRREERANRPPLKLTGGGIDRGAMHTIAVIEAQLASLAQELYVTAQPDGTLSRGERELLGIVAAAAKDSLRSMDLHAACAAELLSKEKPDRTSSVKAVMAGDFTLLNDKLRALAEMVRTIAADPGSLTQEHLDKAAKTGSSGTDILLALTIACAEGLFSGRMEAMRVPTHVNPENYRPTARNIARHGYKQGFSSNTAPVLARRPKPQ